MIKKIKLLAVRIIYEIMNIFAFLQDEMQKPYERVSNITPIISCMVYLSNFWRLNDKSDCVKLCLQQPTSQYLLAQS